MGGWPWQGHQRAHLEEGPPPRTLIPTRQLGAGWVSECTGPDASGPQRPHQGACRAVPTTECREKEKAPSPGLPGWQLSEISHGTPESQLAPHKRPGPTNPLTRGRAGRGPPGPPTASPSGALSPGLPNPQEPHTPGFSTSATASAASGVGATPSFSPCRAQLRVWLCLVWDLQGACLAGRQRPRRVRGCPLPRGPPPSASGIVLFPCIY